jgi:hypothetical protein
MPGMTSEHVFETVGAAIRENAPRFGNSDEALMGRERCRQRIATIQARNGPRIVRVLHD